MSPTRAISPHNSNFVKRLIASGVMPPECTRMVLTIAANDIIRLYVEMNVMPEQMEEIVAALEANPEEVERIARQIVFCEPATGQTADVKL